LSPRGRADSIPSGNWGAGDDWGTSEERGAHRCAGSGASHVLQCGDELFHAGHSEVAEIETAYHNLTPLLGTAAAGIFLVSLLASGVSSSVVGTLAGQMIMQGFFGFAIPIWVRRLATMLPAFIVEALGVDTMGALVLSQVVLSLALPVPMIALVIFTRRADIMGRFASRGLVHAAAVLGTVMVLTLNLLLIVQTFGSPVSS
jgi:manganese transport protein